MIKPISPTCSRSLSRAAALRTSIPGERVSLDFYKTLHRVVPDTAERRIQYGYHCQSSHCRLTDLYCRIHLNTRLTKHQKETARIEPSLDPIHPEIRVASRQRRPSQDGVNQ